MSQQCILVTGANGFVGQAIEQLLANPEQRTAMGLAGRKLAEAEFDVRAVVDKHLAIYQRLLASR